MSLRSAAPESSGTSRGVDEYGRDEPSRAGCGSPATLVRAPEPAPEPREREPAPEVESEPPEPAEPPEPEPDRPALTLRPAASPLAAPPPASPLPAPRRRPRPPRRRRLPPPVPVRGPPSPLASVSLPWLPLDALGAPLPLTGVLAGDGSVAGCGPGRESPIRGRIGPGGTAPPPSGASVVEAGSGGPCRGCGSGAPEPGLSGAVTAGATAWRDPPGPPASRSAGPETAGAAGRPGEASPGTRSAGRSRPVIGSDIGKIPSRGRATRARRRHPPGDWRSTRRSIGACSTRRSIGAPVRGAAIIDEHSVPVVQNRTPPGACDDAALAVVDQDGTDDVRGRGQQSLRQRSLRRHPA
jgi:hypothetical protein